MSNPCSAADFSQPRHIEKKLLPNSKGEGFCVITFTPLNTNKFYDTPDGGYNLRHAKLILAMYF